MNIDELKSHARAARRDIVTMIYESGIGHPGGALSIIDILTWIYHQEVNLNAFPRTRVVMSKGHAVAAQYALLYQLGKIARSEFNTFRQINSRLQGHPSVKALPDVDATTGLLGQGLSVALGMAAAKKRALDPHRVFAIIGDGEMHEGQIWESLQQAGHMRMDNLVAIIDYNGFSSHDPVNEVINLEPLADKIRNFGWHVLGLQNGNDMHQVADTLMLSRHLKGKPVAIIAHTTKGSGVSYMENNGDWHSKTPSAEQYQQAMEELQS
ncbi:transketolase [Citrobacter amalonaticus]|uniref:transketolase n=1 Tax=Citrobacter amalonaticus TaxID=35703 RepID=UPI00300C23C2